MTGTRACGVPSEHCLGLEQNTSVPISNSKDLTTKS